MILITFLVINNKIFILNKLKTNYFLIFLSDNEGWTPLHEAANGGYLRVAEMLLDYGSELDAGDNQGRTSLHVACERAGQPDIVRLLVSKGANLEAKSHEGSTPLRVACFNGNKEIARYLCERGAQVNARDADGRTILMACLLFAAAPENSNYLNVNNSYF